MNLGPDLFDDPEITTTFSYRRPAAGTFADGGEGEWQPGAPGGAVNVVGIVRPAKDSELQVLPEGERVTEPKVFYSPVPLLMSDGQGQQSDWLLHHGRTYRVVWTKDYADYGYYFAIGSFVPGGIPA